MITKSIPNLYQTYSLPKNTELVSSELFMDKEQPRSIRFPQWLWDAAILAHETDHSKVLVVLDNGRGVSLDRDEAHELWIYFDKDGDWRKENA